VIGSLDERLVRLGEGGDPVAELEQAHQGLDSLSAAEHILAHRISDPGARDGVAYGVPYLTKANIAVAEQPLDCCSAVLAGYRSPYDATATRRLRGAGFTCLGSTNMDEFAMGSSGETSVLGAPEHPWLSGVVCGGSSSGSAAAVARGLVPFALGSDTGGSVRQPAAFCGLVGLKPTWGRVSRHGLVAHASSLDTIGVIAQTARDAGRVLTCIDGPDGVDSTLADWAHPALPARPRKFVVPRLARDGVTSVVMANMEAVAEQLRQVVDVEHVQLPSLADALGAYVVLAAAEAASNLARYDGSIYGARVEGATYGDTVRRTRNRGFGPEVKLRILLGTEVLRQGHTANAIARARAVVARLAREFVEAVPEDAVCLLPTVPDVAFDLGSRIDDALAMRSADRFTVLASLLGLPAVSVPSGEAARGAPLSVQCVAHRGRDDLALGLANLVEQVCGVEELQASWWRAQEKGGSS